MDVNNFCKQWQNKNEKQKFKKTEKIEKRQNNTTKIKKPTEKKKKTKCCKKILRKTTQKINDRKKNL